MSSLREFRCEVCGTVTTNPVHWFMIECGASRLTVLRWERDSASIPDTRHLCGEAHAQVYISRWFESLCSPPKPDYAAMPSGNLASLRVSVVNDPAPVLSKPGVLCVFAVNKTGTEGSPYSVLSVSSVVNQLCP